MRQNTESLEMTNALKKTNLDMKLGKEVIDHDFMSLYGREEK